MRRVEEVLPSVTRRGRTFCWSVGGMRGRWKVRGDFGYERLERTE